MRTIKFRMWNPHRGKNGGYQPQLNQVMGCLEKQVLFDNGLSGGWDYKSEGFVFEQFTGLLAKNGKEIYEGSDVNGMNGIGKVVYSEERAMWIVNDGYNEPLFHHNGRIEVI